MPPKGWTKPDKNPARCTKCDKLLPAAMLRGFVQQLKRLRADLSKEVPKGDEVALRREAQLAVFHARSTAELLIDDSEHLLCVCDGSPKKRAKSAPSSGDPSTPPGVETTTVRKRGRRAAAAAPTPLRAVD